ncbi:VOC family protein [Streptomyces sp. QTS52]
MTLVTAGVVVLDCADPDKLAAFYTELLAAEETVTTANRIEIRGADGIRLAFRRDMNVTPPSWPRPEDSFQAHLDFRVSDLDEAERTVIALGGRALETKHTGEPHEERGYADPAGHTFTLLRGVPTAPKQH